MISLLILFAITNAFKVKVDRLKTALPVTSIQKYIQEHRLKQLSSFNDDLENGSNFVYTAPMYFGTP